MAGPQFAELILRLSYLTSSVLRALCAKIARIAHARDACQEHRVSAGERDERVEDLSPFPFEFFRPVDRNAVQPQMVGADHKIADLVGAIAGPEGEEIVAVTAE
jgi:hypothetical protein